jgi:hypothetical protein
LGSRRGFGEEAKRAVLKVVQIRLFRVVKRLRGHAPDHLYLQV